MQTGDKINIAGKVYEAMSFNEEINGKRTGMTSPCNLCDINKLDDVILCSAVDCINGLEFLYLKEV